MIHSAFQLILLMTVIIIIQRANSNIPDGCPNNLCRCSPGVVTCKNRGKQLSYIPRLPNKTQVLELYGTYLFLRFPKESFKNITHLDSTEIILKYDGVEDISRDAFEASPLLQILDLSRNSLTISNLCNSLYGLRNSSLSKLHWNPEQIKISPTCFGYIKHTQLKKPDQLPIDYNPTYADCNSMIPYIILAIVLIVVAVGSLITGTVIYRYRWHLWIYIVRSRKGYQNIDGDEFLYDAFVAYNVANRKWVIEKMMPLLETQEHLKLCLHDRDFEVGQLIVDNIIDKMRQSRRIVLVLSNDFVKSSWCQIEMMTALERLFENGTGSVVLLMLEDVEAEHVTNVLHVLLKSTTYLAWANEKTGQEVFWNRLCEALKKTNI